MGAAPTPEVLAEHPALGPVTARGWDLVFRPPSGDAGLDYTARLGKPPTLEDYAALAPRLPGFVAFCADVAANDRIVRAHFATWPASAGDFALVGVMMAGDALPLPWALGDAFFTPDSPDHRRLALQYRALDDNAWGIANITWFPPLFVALFDDDGRFAGIDHRVERGMRSLPAVLTRSRSADGYKHAFFGRRALGSLERIGTAQVGGRKIPLELFMSERRMMTFAPEDLDAFVPMAKLLAEIDAVARTQFPPAARLAWLNDRFTDATPALRRAMAKAFPGAASPADVSDDAFSAALTLKRACFSLSSEDSGGAALTLDYRILPTRVDQYVFAAKFAGDGRLVVVES